MKLLLVLWVFCTTTGRTAALSSLRPIIPTTTPSSNGRYNNNGHPVVSTTGNENDHLKVLRGDPQEWKKHAPNFIFRTLNDIRNAGFSFHHTILRKGKSTLIHYKNHVEAVFVFAGTGTIELCHEGQEEGEGFVVFKLEPGSFYDLGGQERHYLRADPHQDMHVACAFKPPIDGSEDHDSDGVYPAIGEDGILRYQYDGKQAIDLLFKPPVSLAFGSRKNGYVQKQKKNGAAASHISAPAAPVVSSKTNKATTVRYAQVGDGKAMWQLAQDAGLDLNSSYMYNLFCRQFTKTCAVAVVKDDDNDDEDGFSSSVEEVVAYTLAYHPPSSDPSEGGHRDDTIFVWQIGVHPDYQKQGIALDMLNFLTLDRTTTNLQATVTAFNEPSNNLFRKFASLKNCNLRIEEDWVSDDDFPSNDQHPAESLYEIGPFSSSSSSSSSPSSSFSSSAKTTTTNNDNEHSQQQAVIGPSRELLDSIERIEETTTFHSHTMKPNDENNLDRIAHNQQLGDVVKKESNARTCVRRFPFVVKEAQGCTLTDTDGRTYLDFWGCAGTLALGHNHPVQNNAMLSHLKSKQPLQLLDFCTTAKATFVKELFQFLPDRFSDYRVQFCGAGGSDAVDAAIKLCELATGGTKRAVLAFHGAYHGMGQGPLAMMGNQDAKNNVPGLMSDIHFLPFSNRYRQPFGLSGAEGDEAVLKYIETTLDDNESGLTNPACIFLEVIQGEGGLNGMSNWALRELSRITQKHNIPLVVDEIQTGFCRTGRKFAFEHAGITPDVVIMSKAIGGSQPLSCILFKPEIDKWDPGMHAGTFRGNGLAFSAGAATLQYMRENKLWEQAESKGRLLRDLLVASNCRYIGDIRGKGLMIVIELVDPTQQDEDGLPKASGELCAQAQVECLKRRLIIEKGGRGGSVLRPLPPLIVTKDQIKQAAAIIVQSISAAAEKVF